MDRLLYCLARSAVALIQRLPLRWAAKMGRAGGAVAYWLDGRHRRVALRNLKQCFGAEKSPEELRRIARENFRRIGENFVSAIKTASLSDAELDGVLEVVGAERLQATRDGQAAGNCIVAIGHFGNFELYARRAICVTGLSPATTYRGLKHPSLNRLLQSLRERSGCRFFERRTDAKALREALNGSGMLLGLLADQHAGDHGLWLPFLGRECSTSAAPAVLALRYRATLYTAICYRADLARWVIEIGEPIPTYANGEPRSVEDIVREMNRAFEKAILRDPPNWFWVHQRWKPRKGTPRRGNPDLARQAVEPLKR